MHNDFSKRKQQIISRAGGITGISSFSIHGPVSDPPAHGYCDGSTWAAAGMWNCCSFGTEWFRNGFHPIFECVKTLKPMVNLSQKMKFLHLNKSQFGRFTHFTFLKPDEVFTSSYQILPYHHSRSSSQAEIILTDVGKNKV